MASISAQHGRHTGALILVATGLAAIFVAATLPTPLYPLYRRTFDVGTVALTLVYSIYVLGNLSALFFFARLSDQAGRRFTVLAAIGAALASTAAYGMASSMAWLFVARALSGFATGLASSAMTTWIAELYPKGKSNAGAVTASSANFAGLALGPWLGALPAQFALYPLRFPFIVYFAILAIMGVLLSRVRETVTTPERRLSRLSLQPRFGVPREILAPFIAPVVTAFITFALVGFYAALIPGVLADALQEPRPVVAAAVIFLLFAVAAIAVVASQRLPSRVAMLASLALAPFSVALLIAAERLHSMPLLLIASVLAGTAESLGYRGGLAVVNRIAPPEHRGEVLSTYLIAMYCGNSLPVIGIGLLGAATSSAVAHAAFACLICVLAIAGLAVGLKYAPRN